MEIIETSQASVLVRISRDELLIMHASLNEVCNGIEIFEFETRVGADRDRVRSMLDQIGSVLDSMKDSDE
jgi:hypothetical protein